MHRWAVLLALLGSLCLLSCAGRDRSGQCRLVLEAPTGEIGFESEVTIHAREVCAGCATPASVTWSTGQQGPSVTVKTPSGFERLVRGPRAGVLAVSEDQAHLRIQARTATQTAEVELLLAHRHSGLTAIPVGVPVYVYGGVGGTVQRVFAERPSRIAVSDPVTGFTIDLTAGRPDTTPLDCGRSDCHAKEAARHALTHHASALKRALADGRRDLRCLRCHAVGSESGVPGGFVDVATRLGITDLPSRPLRFEELPRPLRRLGNVGCVACHGPGRIPDMTARAVIYSAGVCAQCHDAPPRYSIVQEWRSSRMSQLPSEALAPACVGCHTASGFVNRLRGRPVTVAAATAEPVTCAACHDPHGPGSTNAHLLRVVDEHAGSGALCVNCHRPDLAQSPAQRVAERRAPMAPQSVFAPADCPRCHRPHTFRAPVLDASAEAQARTFLARLTAAKAELEAKLPTVTGCNPRALVARRVAVVGDRLALVDEKGVALGDCNDDGNFDGEDSFLSETLAERLYARWYDFFTVERDKTRGRHNPALASRLLERALRGAL